MTTRLGPTSAGHGGDAFTDEDVQDYGDTLLSTGVSQYATIGGSYGDDLEVTVGSGLQVLVGTGQAWVRGAWFKSDASTAIALSAADPSLDRYDLIVLKKDISANPMLSLTKRTGTPGSSPVAPTPTQNETVWELVLCKVHVVAGATTLSGGDLTDQRIFARANIGDHTINTAKYAPGSVDDAAIGDITVDDTTTIATDTEALSVLLSAIVNQLKTLKNDGTEWYDPIDVTKSLYYLSGVLSETPKTWVNNKDVHITSTTDVDHCGYSDSSPSTELGQFVATLSFVYKNGTPQKPKGYIRYYSARLAINTVAYFQLANTAARGQYLDGSQATSPGNNQDCVTSPLSFYADASHGIEIHFQDPGGTPDCYVTVGLTQLPN